MAFYQHEPKTNLMTTTTTKQFIFHVDLDAFFAAVEIRENPSLKGKPVMVGGEKETKRGVVTTCNYEARKYGVRSGMSAKEAIELCPEIICIPRGNYSLYRQVSDNIMDILNSYTEQFRRASIDEAYLNLTEAVVKKWHGYPIPLAQEIKKEIYEEERITCSIGIGPNTTIAKIATSRNKPDGITYVTPKAIRKFLAPLPVKAISGIGPKTAERLKKKHQITTIGQIIALGTEFEMIRKFGRLGSFFYRVISGKGRTIIEPKSSYGSKSISKGRTFYGELFDGEPLTVEQVLPKLITQVYERTVKKRFRYKTITLDVRFQRTFQNVSRSKSFLTANDDFERLRETTFELLNDIQKDFEGEVIRKVAVRVSNLQHEDPLQKPLSEFFTNAS